MGILAERNYQRKSIKRIILGNLVCSIKVFTDILDIVLHKRVKGYTKISKEIVFIPEYDQLILLCLVKVFQKTVSEEFFDV